MSAIASPTRPGNVPRPSGPSRRRVTASAPAVAIAAQADTSDDDRDAADAAKLRRVADDADAGESRRSRAKAVAGRGRSMTNVPRGENHWRVKQRMAREAAAAARASAASGGWDGDDVGMSLVPVAVVESTDGDSVPVMRPSAAEVGGESQPLLVADAGAKPEVSVSESAFADASRVAAEAEASASAARAAAIAAAAASAAEAAAAAAAAVAAAEAASAEAAASAAAAAGHILPGALGTRRYYPRTTLSPGAEARTGSVLLAAALLHAAAAGVVAALVDSTDAALPYYLRVVGMASLPRSPSTRFHPLCLPLLGWAPRSRLPLDALHLALPRSVFTKHMRAVARTQSVIEDIDAPDRHPSVDEWRTAMRAAALPPIDDEIVAELADVQATLAALQTESDGRVAEVLERCASSTSVVCPRSIIS